MQIAEGASGPDSTVIKRNVSIFDLDGTLTDRDTFLQYLIVNFINSPARWWRGVFLGGGVILYFAKLKDNTWLKILFLKHIFGGRTRADVERRTQNFLTKQIRKDLLAAGLAAIEEARRSGHVLILASASPDLYVAALARQLGFEHVICTKVGWTEDGRLNPVLTAGNCYGETKKRLVCAYLETLKGAAKVTFYTDHHSDLPLLQMVDQPVAVNPTPKLRAAAIQRHILIVNWA